jgi:hypothetical protein
MVEGLTIGVLGGVALAWSMGYTRFGEDGIPMLGLKVTPPHAGVLGFDPRDSVLYGALCAYNLVTSACLAVALLKKRVPRLR